jgi:hypothetical protein
MKEKEMRISILPLAIALAIAPICIRGEQFTQAQTNASKTTRNSSDTAKVKDDSKISKVKDSDDKAKAGTKADNTSSKSTYISPDIGLGPIKEIKLGAIDTSMVSKGLAFFQGQCVACHQLDKKVIGPALRNVTKERPPEFIMNMILNTDIMEKKDPEVKKMIGQYGTYMSVLDIKQDQARQLLEFLRWAATQPPGK